jgi:polyhydroxyalkanoate synthase
VARGAVAAASEEAVMFDVARWTEVTARRGQRPPVAPTPYEVVHRENKLRLLYYAPIDGGRGDAVPVLIVNSLVNRYYILDLLPGRSYVEYLANRGVAVYMIDWGVPDDSDRHVTLGDHLLRYLDNAIKSACAHAGVASMATVGYCMGGTMALVYTALRPASVQGLVLLATPVDFHNDSLLSVWSRPEYFDVDAFVDVHGNAPADVLHATFMMLRPTKHVTKYADLATHIDDEAFVSTYLAFDYWVNDAVPVAGETFRQFVKDLYQENRLARGGLTIDGSRVRLKAVRRPLLNVVAEHDTIVPRESSEAVMELVGSRTKEQISIKGGHHGLSIGPAAQSVVWPKTVEWLRSV